MIDLKKPVTTFRANTGGGVVEDTRVDFQGGKKKAGLISGVSVITRGEALGHDLWIDDTFVEQVGEAIQASNMGVKSRFTHPGLSGDGTGKFLGRFKGADLGDGQLFSDFHISPAANKSPDGKLGDYVLELADDDPDAFGVSIAFQHDPKAEREFINANTEVDADGSQNFISPDPQNEKNYPHARLEKLRAVDVVDSPAANPNGLFHRGDEIADEADQLLSYSLGLSDKAPALSCFDIDPDRALGFVARYLDRHDLEIKPKGHDMPKPTAELTDAVVEAPEAEATETEETAEVETEETAGNSAEETEESPGEVTEPAAETSTDTEASEGQKFLNAFGDRGGVWYAEGKSFDEARDLHTAEQAERIEALETRNAQLESADLGGEAIDLGTPADEESPEHKRAKEFSEKGQLSDGAARMAASIRLPGKN